MIESLHLLLSARRPPPDMPKSNPSGRWHRQPILWLGFAILLASLAGCITMIVLGARYADEPLPGQNERFLIQK